MQKLFMVSFLLCIPLLYGMAQSYTWTEKLNTGIRSKLMNAEEKKMLYEINKVRFNPAQYAKENILHRLENAKLILAKEGKGEQNYATVTTHETNKQIVDTVWFFMNVEEVHALQTLWDTLQHLAPLSILEPDDGIYKACQKHAADQQKNGTVNHLGNDGTWPWDRITKFSPKMQTGNENIAYNSSGDHREIYKEIVLQLLIDSGIGGYGHRYNMLNSSWTHAACLHTKAPGWKTKWWIQNFGELR